MNIGEVKNKAECPACKAAVEFTLVEIAAESSVTCGGCGASIKLTDKDGGAKKLIKEMNDITSQFPKKITLKF
ncbi:hypothetical protein EPO33_00830 [Patescibacteria group bacterium]|nr:MAG: hypothetical protein EPO33_00830 [Patescibacteria group bacterium]